MKYNVGDKVRIKSIDWYNENKDEDGDVPCNCNILFLAENKKYLGTTQTVERVYICEGQYVGNYIYKLKGIENTDWTDEMIEGLVEEETKPKFKVGDEVRIKGTDIGGTIESVIRGQLIVNSKGSKIPAWPEDVVLMKSVEEECPQDFIEKYCKSYGTQRCDRTKEYLDGCPYYNAYMCIKQNNDMEEEMSLDKAGQITDFEYEGLAYTLPDGYQFVDENGNVINTTKIVLEKKHNDKLKLESTKTVREYWSEYARIYIEIYEDEPNECVLTHLYTLEGHRQKGYGRQALIEAESIAKELGCHTTYLKVETDSWIHEWYLRMGYKWYKNVNNEYTWLVKSI